MTQTIDVLKRFVSRDDLRPHMMHPFGQEEYYAATDGHTCVYIEKSKSGDLNLPEQDKPYFKSIIPKPVESEQAIINVEKFNSFLNESNTLVAEFESIECKECGGAGYQECDLGHDHECERCDGEGSFDGAPTGRMIPTWEKCIQIQDTMFNARKIFEIAQVAKVLGVTEIKKLCGKELKASLFEVGDFNFILMPVSKVTDDDERNLMKFEL